MSVVLLERLLTAQGVQVNIVIFTCESKVCERCLTAHVRKLLFRVVSIFIVPRFIFFLILIVRMVIVVLIVIACTSTASS